MDRLAHFREKQTEAEAEQLDGSHQTCSESPGPAASAPPKPVHRARRERAASTASTTRRCCSSFQLSDQTFPGTADAFSHLSRTCG